MAPATETRVGMIGLGAMGQGIALNLAEAVKTLSLAQPLLVWNRTEGKAAEVLAVGAQFAGGGVAEVARACDITFCMPFDDASLLHILDEYCQHSRPGACFVSMPTVHPKTTTEACRRAAEAGVLLVACPVFGRPDAARAGQLVCALAGPAPAKAAVAPFLAGISRATLDLGEDPAAASAQKLVGNLLIVGAVELLGEAMTLGDRVGLTRDHFLAFVQAFFPAPLLLGYATRMAHDQFSTNGGRDGFTVAGGIKDASLIKQLADEQGVPARVAEAALDNLVQQREQGQSDKDFGSLVEAIRQKAARQL